MQVLAVHHELGIPWTQRSKFGERIVGVLAPLRQDDGLGPALSFGHGPRVDEALLGNTEALVFDDLRRVVELHLAEHHFVEFGLPPVKMG